MSTIRLIEDVGREQIKLRAALLGPSGSGKSYTAMRLAQLLAQHYGTRVAAIDTEHMSLRKYVGETPDGFPWRFGVVEPTSFAVDTYIEALDAIERSKLFGICVIDSLSHAWAGKGGILEFVDTAAAAQARLNSTRPNSFEAWRKATPKHNELVERMLSSQMHLIVTMRTKTEYVQEKDERGKTVIRKVGMQPVQREGLEYEFDIIADIDLAHSAFVSKTRCSAITDMVFDKPGPALARLLIAWLDEGSPPAPPPPPTPPTAAATTTGDGAEHKVPEHKPRLPLSRYSPEKQGEFMERAMASYGVNEDVVYAALEVSSLSQFDGTAIDAKAILDAVLITEDA